MVWIAHVSCGSGHKKAAQAVFEAFKDKEPVFFLNLLDFCPRFLKFLYEHGYRILIKHLPCLWLLIYKIYYFKFMRRLLILSHVFAFGKFIKSIINEKPAVVVTTHFFIAQLVSWLKEKSLVNCKLITVITDFGVHPLWVNPRTDYYVAASAQVEAELRKRYRISSDRIKVWGLPLRQGFFTAKAEELSLKYDKPKGIFTVLLFSSDFGIGPLKEIIARLNRKCGLLVITGKNESVKKYIGSLEQALYLRSFDYKEEIWELMSIADMAVTKAGGLSVAECLAMRKPLIIMHAVYGQESYNVKYVLDNGLGFRPRRTKDLISMLEAFVENPGRLKEISSNFDKIKTKDCAQEIKRLALE